MSSYFDKKVFATVIVASVVVLLLRKWYNKKNPDKAI